ncbi:MAG: ATP-binding protein [Algicola sp.]|nr:ATP-binding protein [Algicola sp.]
MLKAIEINNFKSAEKLKLEFGRVNVFIGENGSGKSTILEAITFASAAESNKLDSEFLENRGIRVTSPMFMRSNFSDETIDGPIQIKVDVDGEGSGREYKINHTNETYGEWQLSTDTTLSDKDGTVSTLSSDKRLAIMQKVAVFLSSMSPQEVSDVKDSGDKDAIMVLSEFQRGEFTETLTALGALVKSRQSEVTTKLSPLKGFVIYSPQNKQLRNLTEEGSIRPVGIHGEGLFKLLREIHAKQPDAMVDIEAGLSLIGWYKSMDLDNEPELPEDELYIQDKYLSQPFTQRSANEGFLYVLFYMALIVSKDTPKIFAIDNIDAALNPKLCAKITSYLVELAKKYDKQLFLTTQNPATLDGIDVFDEEQKLFVVSRKRKGQTTVREFTSDRMPKTDSGESVMLSEAMIRGYIGGLPKGF